MATIDYKQKIKDYMNSSEVDTLYKSMLNNLFPELKENKDKDEKTRKSLIILLQHFCKGYRVPGLDFPVSYKDMLAWLEKQGEHANFRNKIQVGDKVTRNEDGVLVNLSQLNRVAKKQDEQNPTEWKGEDYGIYKSIIDDAVDRDLALTATQKEWIRNLKPQPKQEWSEEDERHLNSVIKRTVAYGDSSIYGLIKDDIDWLKSLKDRHTWKPSDGQMEALSIAMQGVNDPLFSLYQDLKKLKG